MAGTALSRRSRRDLRMPNLRPCRLRCRSHPNFTPTLPQVPSLRPARRHSRRQQQGRPPSP